jgi:hypothetical protein
MKATQKSTNAAELSPRPWYEMPGYAQKGEVLCLLGSAQSFKASYATLGFNERAKLDEGTRCPTAFAPRSWLPTARQGSAPSRRRR